MYVKVQNKTETEIQGSSLGYVDRKIAASQCAREYEKLETQKTARWCIVHAWQSNCCIAHDFFTP